MARRLNLVLMAAAVLASGCISPRRGTTTTGPNTGGKLYVATAGAILRYGNALTASGNVAPEATVTGSATLLSSPRRILLDGPTNRLFVANQGAGSVLIFNSASTMTGNVAPTTVLTSTGNMVVPLDVAVDSSANLLYVADGKNILVFSGQSTLNGTINTPPVRTITFAFSIGAIFLDAANNRLFIADPASNTVNILPGASAANGSGTLLVSPITGAATQLNLPNGIALDGTGRLIVSNSGSAASITIFSSSIIPGGGNLAPVATISGAATKLSSPGQLAFNSNAGTSGEVYVEDSVAASVLTYLNIGAINGNVAPARDITGAGTGLNANAVNGLSLDTTR